MQVPIAFVGKGEMFNDSVVRCIHNIKVIDRLDSVDQLSSKY